MFMGNIWKYREKPCMKLLGHPSFRQMHVCLWLLNSAQPRSSYSHIDMMPYRNDATIFFGHCLEHSRSATFLSSRGRTAPHKGFMKVARREHEAFPLMQSEVIFGHPFFGFVDASIMRFNRVKRLRHRYKIYKILYRTINTNRCNSRCECNPQLTNTSRHCMALQHLS